MTQANIFTPPSPDEPRKPQAWTNLFGSSKGLAITSLIQEVSQPVFIITPDMNTAAQLEMDMQFFQSESFDVLHFTDWETLPYDHFSPHQDIISNRLTVLHQIPLLKKGAIIAPVNTLMHQLPPVSFLGGQVLLMRVGEKLNIEQTRGYLEKSGYRHVSQVREHGEYAIRGSILDLFPMGSTLPFRIDLLHDEIDSIRTFATDNQRSLDRIEKIELFPAKEFPLNEQAIERFRESWRSQFSGNPLNCPMYQEISEGICTPGIEYYLPLFFEKTATLFDYLPKNSILILIGNIHQKSEEFWQEIKNRYEQRSHDITRPILSPEQIFIPTSLLFNQINQHTLIKIEETIVPSTRVYQFNTSSPPSLPVDHRATKPLHNLENFLKEFHGRVLFCAESAGRREVLLNLFKSLQLQPKIVNTWTEFFNSTEQYAITIAPLNEGFNLSNPSLAMIAETQIFGHRLVQQRQRKESIQDPEMIIKDLTELQIGDPIVHIDHGVGRYLGLQILNIGEQTTEFLTIEYADHAKLYVPVASLHLVNRYSGAEVEHAPLHKLGTEQWQRAKRKAAEQIRDVAAELLDVYAKREAATRPPYQELDGTYEAFAAAFPFETTPDQQNAINQVIQDLYADKPMDRLVCGDVGFGKTEVAMRAAFIAAQNNKQVAILVPTTLLAEQHFQNFQDRFADWPIRVEVISRFKSNKEQQQIIAALTEGKIDVVIGTHKILQDKVKFKNLGLLVIDEEHRFGVRQKEYLKAIRANVNILTLTATPIPRTLNMAFSGMRDLSIIATPPARRLSIKTFLHEYDKNVIQEAASREILRGGQVYFLHNDVATIERMGEELKKLVHEARVGIAHGQMRERELEQIMSDFYHRRYNLLVCTTIIESGIDVPSANTIIINRADKFGLAQLHQLRGRVGRSHHQAYSYLLIPSYKTLTKDAEKRLEAITAYEDLGIGFTLATHDLEIRGAGELLGEGQSGNMHAIGFTLYMDLLNRAVQALKTGKEPDLDINIQSGIEIDLTIPALIPENYLSDVNLRLQFYKRIASAQTQSELDDIQIEMIDRFGLLPDTAKQLFALTELKQQALKLGICKIDANSKIGKIEFSDKPNVDPIKIINLIQKQSNKFKLEGPTKLRFNLEPHESKERIEQVKQILQSLSEKK